MEGNQKPEYYEDEIELIDYLRVIWKRKWLIIVGMLLCGLAAAIYGFTRHDAKMYRVSALIEIDPLIKSFTMEKTESMIESGMFNLGVLKDLSNSQGISKQEHLTFQVAIPTKGLNILDVGYKTPDVDLGKAVLNSVVKQLEEQFKEECELARYQLDKDMKTKDEHINDIQTGIETKKRDGAIEIARLKSQIRTIQFNIQLIEKRCDNDIIVKERDIRVHKANIKALREKVKIVNGTREETKRVLKETELSRKKLIAQREGIDLGSHGETGYLGMFMQCSCKLMLFTK